MKKLPLGIQSFPDLIKHNGLFIDKGNILQSLLKASCHILLTRPPHFGKTLLLSQIASFFQGDKALFANTSLSSLSTGWPTFPTLFLDFSTLHYDTQENLKNNLNLRLALLARQATVSLPKTDETEVLLASLLESLFQKTGKPAVLLVDGYDLPIASAFDHPKQSQQHYCFIQRLFSSLPSLQKALHASFFVGTYHFQHLLPHPFLEDITYEKAYATLLGFTREEIASSCCEQLQMVEKTHCCPSTQLLDKIGQWYGGYRFHADAADVHHPLPLFLFFESGDSHRQWFYTKIHPFLIKKLVSNPLDLLPLYEKAEIDRAQQPLSLSSLSCRSLLLQEGYLSMSQENGELVFPNRESKRCLLSTLFRQLHPGKAIEHYHSDISIDLNEGHLERLFSLFEKIFPPSFPETSLTLANYHACLFYLFLTFLHCQVTIHPFPSPGTLFCLIKSDKFTYIAAFSPLSTQAIFELFFQSQLDRQHRHRPLCFIAIALDEQANKMDCWESKILWHSSNYKLD